MKNMLFVDFGCDCGGAGVFTRERTAGMGDTLCCFVARNHLVCARMCVRMRVRVTAVWFLCLFFSLGGAPWGPSPEFFAHSCLFLLKKARFMKFVQLIFSLAVLVLMALCLSASESGILVSNVRAVPRWPWDGKVDIFYVVECDDADAELSLTFSGYGGDKDEWVTMRKGHLSGDGVDTALEFGKEQHAVWNAGEDIPGFHCSAFTVKINANSAGNADYLVVSLSDTGRSEERRVGKECRSRWSPYH